MIHTGPPDSMREHVVAAAHAMLKGDWKNCRHYILSIKAWDLFLNVEQLKEMLARYMIATLFHLKIWHKNNSYAQASPNFYGQMFNSPPLCVFYTHL